MYSSVEVLGVYSTEPNIKDSPIFLVGLLCPDFAIRVIQLPCMPTQCITYYCTLLSSIACMYAFVIDCTTIIHNTLIQFVCILEYNAFLKSVILLSFLCIICSRELLGHLNKEQLTTLEQALCSAEGLGTLERNKLKAAAAAKKKRHAPQHSTSSSSLSPSTSSSSSSSTSLARESHSSSRSTSTLDVPPALPPRSPTRSPSPSYSQTLTVPVEMHQRPNSVSLSPARNSTQQILSQNGANNNLVSSTSSLGSLPRSRSFDLDSRESSSTVFEPAPRSSLTKARQPIVTITVLPGSEDTGGAEGQDDNVVMMDEPEFPRLGIDQPVVNDLPSRRQEGAQVGAGGDILQQQTDNGNTITSATSSSEFTTNSSTILGGDTPPVPLTGDRSSDSVSSSLASSVSLSPSRQKPASGGNSPSKSRRSGGRHKGPAGFPSAEDLMHRLFLGISGVADQLQSNHAKEVRVILKHVFTVCQSEPEPPMTIRGPGASHGSCEVNAIEPCTPEPRSPLITDSQSKLILNEINDNLHIMLN